VKRLLPSPAPSPVDTPALRANVRAGAPDTRVLLIVDDDDGVREALHVILDEDYSVLDVPDGRTALQIVRAQHVDLVLLDILMPDVDGLEILREIRTIASHIPIVMMTAVKTVTTAVAAMKLGAGDYLTKPFQEAHLLATIRSQLDQRQARGPGAEDSAKLVTRASGSHHRFLIVGGDLGWRATLAVLLQRSARVALAPTPVGAIDHALRFRPTCVVYQVTSSPAEASRFLCAIYSQMPTCPALVLTDDPHLQATLAWESLNIRSILKPAEDPAELIRRIAEIASPESNEGGPWPKIGRSVSRTITYLRTHFGEDVSVDSLAKVAGVSASHLAHLFRAEIGLSVRDYLNRTRVEITKDLLSHTNENLADIAAFVGFFDASHLSRVFLQTDGKRPSVYRRSVV